MGRVFDGESGYKIGYAPLDGSAQDFSSATRYEEGSVHIVEVVSDCARDQERMAHDDSLEIKSGPLNSAITQVASEVMSEGEVAF